MSRGAAEPGAGPRPATVCPRCGAPRAGYVGGVCGACAAVLESRGGVGPGRLAKRVLATAATAGALLVWFAFVPVSKWNQTNGLIFGVIAVFSLCTTWIMSGELIEK